MIKLLRCNIDSVPSLSGCALTIGNFDGVHRGHQQLLTKLKLIAEAKKLPTTVMIFEPQPNEFFAKEKIPPRLMRLREKLNALQFHGIDQVICLRFNQTLANLSAEDFVTKILVDKLNLRYLLVGDDFRFGHKRVGDFSLLQQMSQSFNFQAESMPAYEIQGERVSSTRIRHYLARGELKIAEKLLGQPFGLSGRVAHGDKLGRKLGFPTANIFLQRKSVPIQGVFVIRTYGLSQAAIEGVANVGTRPTVGGRSPLLEVHLFDFHHDIYGQHIYIEFLHKLRDEEYFDSLELMKQQIEKDVMDAKKFFAEEKSLIL